MQLIVNGETRTLDVDPDMPLLWLLRDVIGLTGTKFGCGAAQCGACTVLVNGQAQRSCQVPARSLEGAEITTIEGIGTPAALHVVQAAWAENQVAQCGYCQSGQIMQAVDLLSNVPAPTDADIDQWMNGNLCRCGTYPRIRAAIHDAAARLASAVEG